MTNCNYFVSRDGLSLESGESLEQFRLAYSIQGNLKAEKTVWVCHALSGNTNPLSWWSGLFSEDGAINPSEYRIICVNMLGSCYGSTSPAELDEPLTFPHITIKDNAKAFEQLRHHMNIEKVDLLIGASLGGQLAVQWAVNQPNLFEQLILVASNAQHSPYGIAFNEAQRMALKADITFGLKTGGQEGLKAARAIAMLSYRSYKDFTKKQSGNKESFNNFKSASYIAYQGEKFCNRFNPHSYATLTKVMDSHNIGRGEDGVVKALKKITSKTLVIGVDSDTLFPIEEQEFLANHIPNAVFGTISSTAGHDAFLIEYEQLNHFVKDFLCNDFKTYQPTVLKTIK